MARITKAERLEARESLLEALHACGPEGMGTLFITALVRRPSSSGVAEHCEVRVWEPDERTGGPRPTLWLTRTIALAFGYRFNDREETIVMGGYGYCRATQIASDLHKLCGFPLRIESLNYFAGPRGWYPNPPKAQAAE